ncbi:MAG: ribulose-phosphate 3-epimerase [Pyramidobacter sp.]|nr:ribulose-phosphate 3-epimerase [Pyramidobacter sp.]
MAGPLQIKPLIIAPSILSADPLAVGESLNSLEGNFDWLHIDIMDGHFVPNLSYGPAIVKAIRRRLPDAVLDVHLMVEPAEDFLDMFLDARPDYVTIHQESSRHLHRALSHIRSAGVRPGVVLNPATPVEMIKPVLNMVDLVLLMSVNPGFGGQSFIPEVTEKAVELCRMREARGLNYLIEMDGGIGASNLKKVRLSGVDAAVMGSAVFGTPNPAQTVIAMRQIAADADEFVS